MTQEGEVLDDKTQFLHGFSELNEKLKRDHHQRILECKLEKLQALKREIFFQKENERKSSKVLLSKNRHIIKSTDKMNSTLGSTTRQADSTVIDRFSRSNPKIYFKINRLAQAIQPISSLQLAITQQDTSGTIKTTRHLTTRDNVDLIEVEINKPGEVSPRRTKKSSIAARLKVGGHIVAGITSFGESGTRSILKPASPYKLSSDDRPADSSTDNENSALPKYILMMNKTVTEGYVPQHTLTTYRNSSKPRLRPNIYGGNLHVGSHDNIKFLRRLPFPVQVFEDSS